MEKFEWIKKKNHCKTLVEYLKDFLELLKDVFRTCNRYKHVKTG